ncbi:PepSY domain-containing protein [Hyphococcus sp. DH-69]|uniref:PepSY domain-containing protein n=1 Tax=Hyphococcus formosus TaxID=3143534 RepID=UPI00398A7947
MTFKSLIQRVHLWAGLILGIQVLLWMLSGVVMSWFPIELVRGEVSAYSAPSIPLEAETFASPGGIIAQAEGATSLELKRFMGKTVYIARGESGIANGIYDASSGERITPLNEATVRKIAEQDYVGAGNVVRAALLSYPPKEYRAERPVWRVDFDDRFHTRLYIAPNTGEVRARRNDIWRLYDFFWMLHIMDYGEREDFNNPLLMAASLTGLIFAVSGLIVVGYRLRRGRFNNDISLLIGKRSKKVTMHKSEK